MYLYIYISIYGRRSKTFLLKFSKRVCGELLGSLKPASRKFRARPAQGVAQGKLCFVACHVVSSTCFSMLVWQFIQVFHSIPMAINH